MFSKDSGQFQVASPSPLSSQMQVMWKQQRPGGEGMQWEICQCDSPHLGCPKGTLQPTHVPAAMWAQHTSQGTTQRWALGTTLWHLRSHWATEETKANTTPLQVCWLTKVHHLDKPLKVNRWRERSPEGSLPILRSVSKMSKANSLLNLQNS